MRTSRTLAVGRAATDGVKDGAGTPASFTRTVGKGAFRAPGSLATRLGPIAPVTPAGTGLSARSRLGQARWSTAATPAACMSCTATVAGTVKDAALLARGLEGTVSRRRTATTACPRPSRAAGLPAILVVSALLQAPPTKVTGVEAAAAPFTPTPSAAA